MAAYSGLISLSLLAIIHLFANQAHVLGWVWHGRFLSFAAGISFAYVFVDLLPALEKGQPLLKEVIDPVIPYLDHHAYLVALCGVLVFYGLRLSFPQHPKRKFWMNLGGYLVFNFFVGASLADALNPDIQPLILFTTAIGLHYFVHDHSVMQDETVSYERCCRYLLALALFFGYAVGAFTKIPDALVAIVVSFLAGGVLLNSLHYELPKREQLGYCFFVMGSVLYTLIILYKT